MIYLKSKSSQPIIETQIRNPIKNHHDRNPNTVRKPQIHVIHEYEHKNHIFIRKKLGQTLTTCIISLYEPPMRKSKERNHRNHIKSIDLESKLNT